MGIALTLHSELTEKQRMILRSRSSFLYVEGPAGTAKTYTALARGFKLLNSGEVEKIIVIRSAVETRKIGFLPGDHDEKIDVYAEPYIDLVSKISPKKNYRALYSEKKIDFKSTSYLRGVTFENAYVLVDEFQNMSAHELETVLTRVGQGTRLVLCGQSEQSDLQYGEAVEHKRIIRIVTAMGEFEVVHFGIEDIVRSPFVRAYYETKLRLSSEDSAPPEQFEFPGFITKTA